VVVIIPDMQALGGGGKLNMLSWLERGLSDGDTDLPTEFLIAPFSPKGVDGGAIKTWVDHEYRAREKQEMRRLLYVAATRARDELHLFARPAYREQPDGSRTLSKPSESLLGTAWPALEEEIQTQFAAFQPCSSSPAVVALAPMVIRCLPASYAAPGLSFSGFSLSAEAEEHGSTLYTRENGSTESRVLGVAVHSLLEQLAIWRSTSLTWDDCRARLPSERPRLTARARAAGLNLSSAEQLTAQSVDVAMATTNDPQGRWVLDSHPQSGSEVSWTGVLAGQIRTVQADRVFCSGPPPLGSGSETWWIVDFKTAILSLNPDPAELSRLRSVFSPQLDVYARVLRQLHGAATTVMCGLYYPRMLKLDSWSADC
jgi:ATP-dependent helicase/nuclease subunit A